LNITEVRVKLMRNRSDRLRAFCSITIDGDFVVHDLRVIEGRKGLFVAMPSRKLTDNCPGCGAKNELRAKFCNECGGALSHERGDKAAPEKSHVDVAHPINTPCREMLQDTVLAAYREEEQRAGQDVPPVRDDADSGPVDAADEPSEEAETDWAEPEVPDLLPPEPEPFEAPAFQADEPGDWADPVPADEPADLLEPGPVDAPPEEEPPIIAPETEAEAPAEDAPEEPAEQHADEEEAPPRPPARAKQDKDVGGFGEGIF